MARPRPRPPCVRVIELSAWRKRSKTCGRKLWEIPAPVSRTVITTCDCSRASRSSTRPSRGVNLTALASRFPMICCRRSGSPQNSAESGESSQTSCTPLASAGGRTASSAERTTACRSVFFMLTRSLPAVMRETSRMSSTSCVCARALRSMVRLHRSGAQHPRPAEDGVERRAQLVRHGGEEFVLGAVGDLRLRARFRFRSQERPVGLLDALLLVDVGGGADPAGDAPMLVALGHHAREVPAPLPVVALQALLALHRLPFAHRLAPGAAHFLPLLLGHAVEEADARLGARVLAPDAVAVVDLAVRPRRPDALGHGIGQRAEAQLSPLLQLDQLLRAQQRLLAAEQLALAPQVDEHRSLGPQDLRVEGLQHVVDRALPVAAEDVRRILGDGGEEDDGDVAVALPLLDQLRRGQAVEARHLHVHEDEGEVGLQKLAQRVLAGVGFD